MMSALFAGVLLQRMCMCMYMCMCMSMCMRMCIYMYTHDRYNNLFSLTRQTKVPTKLTMWNLLTLAIKTHTYTITHTHT